MIMKDVIEGLLELILYAVTHSVDKSKADLVELLESKFRENLPNSEKELFLYLSILMYLFIENDGKFTQKEKKIIKHELKKKKKSLLREEYKTYKAVMFKTHTTDDITKFVVRHNIDSIVINRIFKDIRESINNEESYKKDLKILESKLYSLI